MSKSPVDYNNPSRVTLTQQDVAGLGQAVMALTQELWIVKDRMRVMEAVLADRGIDIMDDIDRYQPGEALQKELNESGKNLVSNIVEALAPQPTQDDA